MKNKIVEELKQALLSKDALRVSTLRMLLAAIVNKEKEKRYKIAKESLSRKETSLSEAELQRKSELSDEEIQQVVAGEAKKRKESIEAFEKGGRKDLVEKEQKELEILQRYLPEQLSEDEVRKFVQEAIASTSASSPKDIGKVMAALMPKVKARADGALVRKIAQELLAG